ncbi:MAG: hypothetical protein EOO67_00235 [Microbacterium sp.]|nr:MAG: hypothetical protein EOO67_00235 [Microbacterium sp.]
MASTLTACSAAEVETVTGRLTAVRTALVSEYRQLLDERGLVSNPAGVGEQAPAVDLYGSALLVDMAKRVGIEDSSVDVGELSADDIAQYQRAVDVPAEWAWSSVGILRRATGNAAGPKTPSLTLATSADPVDEATAVWLLATARVADAGPDLQLNQRALAVVASGRGGVIAAWRALEACDLLQLTCDWAAKLPRVQQSLSSVAGVLEVRAAGELARRGLVVPGYDPPAALAEANAAMERVHEGDDLLAVNLARTIQLAGGSSDAYRRYLDGAAKRKDARTGLYLMHFRLQGTLKGTYDALRTLDDHFGTLMSAQPTLETVRGLLRTRQPDLEQIRALAIVNALEGLTSDEKAHVHALKAKYSDRRIHPSSDAEALEVAAVLASMGEPPAGLTVETAELVRGDEVVINRIIALAQNRLFDDSDQIMATFSAHVSALADELIDAGTGDPLFYSRLEAISNEPSDLTASQVTRIASMLRSLRGCPQFEQMFRADSTRPSSCELSVTKVGVNSGFGM